VGLPLVALLAEKGHQVIGFDVDEARVSGLKSGHVPFHEPGLDALLTVARSRHLVLTSDEHSIASMDVPMVTVGTPWNEKSSRPDFSQLDSVTKSIGSNLKTGAVVVLKSTLAPGTTEERVIPHLQKISGMKAIRDFGVAFSPERMIEGRALEDFRTLPKIIGASDDRSFDVLAAVLGTLGGAVRRVGSIRVAEMVKMLDNYNRAGSIAIINQFALSCEAAGVDVKEVIDAAKFDYPRNSGILIPGTGVGGSCLNKDPLLLEQFSKAKGVDTRLILDLQRTNRQMPKHTVELVKEVAARLRVSRPLVVVAGVGFKSGTDDTRFSPGVAIARSLKRLGFNVKLSDPFVPNAPELGRRSEIVPDLYTAAEKANIVVLSSDHSEYRDLDLGLLKRRMAPRAGIVDGRHMVDPRRALALGFEFEGVGRPKKAFA
jgi:UDP-N-acetyl-D-mannosaminuronic acid dehydrogenase